MLWPGGGSAEVGPVDDPPWLPAGSVGEEVDSEGDALLEGAPVGEGVGELEGSTDGSTASSITTSSATGDSLAGTSSCDVLGLGVGLVVRVGVGVDVPVEVAVGVAVGEGEGVGLGVGVGVGVGEGVGVGVGVPPPPPDALGVTAEDAVDAGPIPAAFVAVTVNVNAVPLDKPVMEQDVDEVEHDCPPDDVAV